MAVSWADADIVLCFCWWINLLTAARGSIFYILVLLIVLLVVLEVRAGYRRESRLRTATVVAVQHPLFGSCQRHTNAGVLAQTGTVRRTEQRALEQHKLSNECDQNGFNFVFGCLLYQFISAT